MIHLRPEQCITVDAEVTSAFDLQELKGFTRSAALSRNPRWRADANAALTVTADRQVIRAGKAEQRVVDGEERIARPEGVIDELGSIGSLELLPAFATAPDWAAARLALRTCRMDIALWTSGCRKPTGQLRKKFGSVARKALTRMGAARTGPT
jgi:hypothetical protein